MSLLVVSKSLRSACSIESIMVTTQHPFILNLIITMESLWEYKLKERSPLQDREMSSLAVLRKTL